MIITHCDIFEKNLKGKRWQALIDSVQNRSTVSVPHWPHDIPEAEVGTLTLYIEDPRSYYRFSSGRHIVMFCMASKFTMGFSAEVLEEAQGFVEKLDDIWHETYPA